MNCVKNIKLSIILFIREIKTYICVAEYMKYIFGPPTTWDAF
jgi:hypothetical protein